MKCDGCLYSIKVIHKYLRCETKCGLCKRMRDDCISNLINHKIESCKTKCIIFRRNKHDRTIRRRIK